ncbi:cytochrome b/b6 domain-containing protein [Thioflexithrix psekupsensis]|uniref:Cytochrome B n=1 Tax=Thioflexithrix psekupsensis TaxID=1570016 RepID=A0A251XAD4_9GAMM|nr:cytochrome b/b6 domain-containing protein [Thioflexithrix psekupsensis]OUD15391.1 cytochrome B [Thioflexithrix psekupsensis]
MNSTPHEIPIWDGIVRLFHWSIVVLFFLNFFILEDGERWHEWAGYVVGALLLLRFVWGFIGSHNARFCHFFPTYERICHHLTAVRARQFDPTEGHNPIGALMIFLLLLLLSLTVISGWMLTLDTFWGVEWVEETHEMAANLTLLAVIVHVSAVVIMGKVLGISLIRPMITGKRRL